MNANLNKESYETEILSFLQGKYDEEFEIVKLYQEFEGDSGMMVRALCRGAKYDDEFLVCCYLDSTIANELIEIDGNKHSIEDSYSEVILQNQFLNLVTYEENLNVIIKCNVDFYGRNPSSEEIQTGMYCLKEEELNAYLKVYIITDNVETTRKVQEDIEKLLIKYEPCNGYLYHAEKNKFNKDEIEKIFRENQHDFGNFLSSSDFANKVEFSLYRKEEGLKERQIIRG